MLWTRLLSAGLAGVTVASYSPRAALAAELSYPADFEPGVEYVTDDLALAGCCEPSCEADDAVCGGGLDGGCGDDVGGDLGCGDECGPDGKKKAPPKPNPNPCLTSHKPLFYSNDFSYLKDPKYKGHCLGDELKLMPVGECGKYGTLDVGGQARLRYHDEEGMGRQAGRAGFQDTENTFLLSRIRLYGDYKANENLRVYVEGITADETGNSAYQPRQIDVNYGDLLNAFVDVKTGDALTMRVGRQELLFGNQRLVSPLDWANTRRTFEGVRGIVKDGDWQHDVFYTNLVPVDDDDFDEADYDQSFYGCYSVYSGWEGKTLDLYYLGYDDQRNLQPYFSDFSLHTVGTRLNGVYEEVYLYEFEGGYQGGRQSGLGLDHDAGFATVGVGKKLDHKWKPTLWLYYDYASGNVGGGDFNRFNQLFPLGHRYLGFTDAAARANIEAPNALLTLNPHQKWNFLLWYWYIGANQESDVIPPVATSSNQNLVSDDFGNALDFIAQYQITPRSNALVGYSHLWAGDKIIGADDASFLYAEWTLNF
ncbi:MAG: alginate export family protein [Lacipirellulaceae bacterium]